MSSSDSRGRNDPPPGRPETASVAKPAAPGAPPSSKDGDAYATWLDRMQRARAPARGDHEESLHLVQLQELGGPDEGFVRR